MQNAHIAKFCIQFQRVQGLSKLPKLWTPTLKTTDHVSTTTATNLEQPQVIPSPGDLLGDLLNLDLGPPVNVPQVSSMQVGAMDLLGGGTR